MKTSFTLDICWGGTNGRQCWPALGKSQIFSLIESVIEKAVERGDYVTFSGEEWETYPGPGEIMLQISEEPYWSEPVAFRKPKVRLPRSAGGKWPDWDEWRKQQKNEVEIV